MSKSHSEEQRENLNTSLARHQGPYVDVPPDKLYLMPEFPSQTVVPEHGEDNALSSGGSKLGMGKGQTISVNGQIEIFSASYNI